MPPTDMPPTDELIDAIDRFEIAENGTRLDKSLSTRSAFPLEVWESVFTYVTSPRDLKNLCLVNSRFYGIAIKLLWYHPDLKPYDIDQFESIYKMPIRVFDTVKFTRNSLLQEQQDEELQLTKRFFRMVGTISCLQSLTLSGKLLLTKDILLELNGLESLRTLSIPYHPRILSFSDFVDGMSGLLSHLRKLTELILIFRIERTEGVRISSLVDSVVKAKKLKILTFMLALDDPYDEVLEAVKKLHHLKILHVRLNAYFRFEETVWHERLRKSCDSYLKYRTAAGANTQVVITL